MHNTLPPEPSSSRRFLPTEILGFLSPSMFAQVQALADSEIAPDECVEPEGFQVGNSGYRVVVYREPNGRRNMTTVHRLVLAAAVGDPPDGSYQAAHAPVICHNRACVNPRHLRWATAKENIDDIVVDGILVPCDRSQNHRRPVVNQTDIAEELGITQATVSRVFSDQAKTSPEVDVMVREMATRLGYVHRPQGARHRKPSGER